MKALLRLFGFYKINYGFASGRHWIEIDGRVIAQTLGDDVWLRDEDVHRIGYVVLDKGRHWCKPEGCDPARVSTNQPSAAPKEPTT